MSAWSCRSTDGKADQQIVPPRPRIPRWKGPGADSEEKHEPASDIDTALMDSLKVLDPERPIREAEVVMQHLHVCRAARAIGCGRPVRGKAHGPEIGSFTLWPSPQSHVSPRGRTN